MEIPTDGRCITRRLRVIWYSNMSSRRPRRAGSLFSAKTQHGIQISIGHVFVLAQQQRQYITHVGYSYGL
jgi:hypothetical protein